MCAEAASYFMRFQDKLLSIPSGKKKIRKTKCKSLHGETAPVPVPYTSVFLWLSLNCGFIENVVINVGIIKGWFGIFLVWFKLLIGTFNL